MSRVALMLIAALVSAAPIQAQSVASEDPLAPMARLIGGKWYLGTSYQVFEWGLERRSIVASMYVETPDGPQRVSDLTFAYHPGHEAVKGYGVAIGMGVDFFEYEIEFEGDVIVLDLDAYGPAAGDGTQRETWTFTDDDHYEWVLHSQDGNGGWAPQMDGTFERRR